MDLTTFLQQQTFECVKKLGLAVEHVVDIGANRGNWTRMAMRYFPEAFYSLFEPVGFLSGYMRDLLNHPKVRLNQMGVGAVTGMMLMTPSSRDDSYSFAVSKEDAKKAGIEQIRTPVIRLDDYMKLHELDQPEVVKIDAEGWDLEVLEGGKNTVSGAELVFIEAGVMNKGFRNSFLAVANRMEELGFRIFDITDLNRNASHNALWLVEIAFIRKDGWIDSRIQSF